MANEGMMNGLQDARGDSRHDKLDSASDSCCVVPVAGSKVQSEAGSCSDQQLSSGLLDGR